MCLIIYKPEVLATFNDEYMMTSINRNSDGAGCMYVEEGRVKVEKIEGTFNNSVSTKDIFDWCVERIQKYDKIAIHHRMTTDGCNHLDNIHPYKVLSIDDGDDVDLYMMHNGIIHKCRPDTPTHVGGSTNKVNPSDTQVFVSSVLKPILKHDPAILYLPAFKILVEEYISKGSKLLFVDSNDNWTIINESAGVWQDDEGGCWISNTYSHKKSPVAVNNNRWSVTPSYTHTNEPSMNTQKTIDKNTGVIPNNLKSIRDSYTKVEFWENKTIEEVVDYLCITNNFDDINTVVWQAPEMAEELLDFLIDFYWNHSNSSIDIPQQNTQVKKAVG